MYHIEKEIAEQPDIIQRLITDGMQEATQAVQAIRDFDPAFVMIAARGTSDNAARYAQYLLSIHANLPVALSTPSVHTLYGSPPNLSRALVIGISQSGQAKDVSRVVTDAREQGALTLSITNDPSSPLAQAAAYHVDLRCGEEISIAATKTYTAQLTAIAMLATALVESASNHQALETLPQQVRETLHLTKGIESWIERYRYMEHMATIGRGYNYSTAFEISLKIKELCYITGEEYSEADFRHGPIAVIDRGFPVIAVAPSSIPLSLLVDLLNRLRKKQAECIVISDNTEALDCGVKTMRLPEGIPEWLSPICAVIPGQVFAMNLALAKGHPVDKPEGLTKVTITE